MNKQAFAALALSTTLLLTAVSVNAENEAPQVSVVNLQVVQHQDGTQSVVTPKGDLAQLPGAGVEGDVAQIFLGSQGGFWYTDKSGKTIDLEPTVRSLQARRAGAQKPVTVPQYEPEPYYPAEVQQNVTVQQEESGDGGSGVMSTLGTAAAAGAGAMMGSAMSRGFYNMPYGTPYHYGNGNGYYYNNGDRHEINELNQNQKAYLYNQKKLDQQNKQQVMDNRQTNQQARRDQSTGNQQGRQDARAERSPQHERQNRGQQENFQRQQQWYQGQLKENPQRFQGQRGESNPFVSQRDGGRRSGGQSGRSAARSSGGGGGHVRSGGGGGRSRGGGGRGGGGGRRGR